MIVNITLCNKKGIRVVNISKSLIYNVYSLKLHFKYTQLKLMQQTIKTYRKVAVLLGLATALTFAGCNGSSNKATSDTTAKKDSTGVAKADSDTTSMKMAPMDSLATPESHMPKKDTSNPRPIDRKTKK